ncbi:hypothetical protein BJ944DRAFT_260477 [Cunninghamella echinulata]|nr:hypothetical protein BJ944DRAFT_260477 [Cunninghamella echinulata]
MFSKIFVLLLVANVALAKTKFGITKNIDKGQSNISSIPGLSVSKRECYLCSYPCDNIYCCDDGHPQCCTIGGQCACCDS